MIEDIKTNPYTIPEGLFKPKELHQMKFYLDHHKEIDPQVIFDLAEQIQKNKRLEVLYTTYHNFFSLKEDKSETELTALIGQYHKDQESYQAETEEFKNLTYKIETGEMFLALIKRYGWHAGLNVTSVFEETLL